MCSYRKWRWHFNEGAHARLLVGIVEQEWKPSDSSETVPDKLTFPLSFGLLPFFFFYDAASSEHSILAVVSSFSRSQASGFSHIGRQLDKKKACKKKPESSYFLDSILTLHCSFSCFNTVQARRCLASPFLRLRKSAISSSSTSKSPVPPRDKVVVQNRLECKSRIAIHQVASYHSDYSCYSSMAPSRSSSKRAAPTSKEFVCGVQECRKAFARRSDLVRHNRIHTNER